MAQFLTKALQVTPNQLLYFQRRFRGKIHVQKPRKPHYLRGVVNTFLTPFYEDPKKDKTYIDLCTKVTQQTKTRKIGPYEIIIAREVRNWFDQSKMIAFVHRNSMTREEQFELQIPLKRANMYYKSYGRKVILAALEDSPYNAVLPLLTSFYGIIFSPDTNVAALEKIIKKCPQLVLIAGILEGRLLDHEEFLKYGKMNIVSAQTELVRTLQTAGGNNLTQQLTHHQSTLVTRLNQIGTNETAPDGNQESVPV